MNTDGDDLRKRTRRPKPGDVAALRRLLWQAALELEGLVQAPNVDTKLKAASALATTAGVYLKVIQQGDFEARLQKLEAAAKGEQDD